MDERTLVARAANGDATAFGSLIRDYQSRIRAFLLRLNAGDHALADDLAQETFLEAFRKIAQYRGDGAFVGWLYRIAYSRFLMNRRRRREAQLDDDPPEGAAATEAVDMARLDLERSMAHLMPEERAALTLCYALGYSNEEAAGILSLPLGTVKSHILRGREKLKRMLEPWSNEVSRE
jgi:RNA polymerase sigma-70 factor, ECF subfamily